MRTSTLRTLAAAALSLALGAPAASLAQDQPAPAGDHQGGGGPRRACEADIKSLCGDVQRGGGRIGQCLREHKDQVSDGCKAALMSARAERRRSGASPEPPAAETPPSDSPMPPKP